MIILIKKSNFFKRFSFGNVTLAIKTKVLRGKHVLCWIFKKISLSVLFIMAIHENFNEDASIKNEKLSLIISKNTNSDGTFYEQWPSRPYSFPVLLYAVTLRSKALLSLFLFYDRSKAFFKHLNINAYNTLKRYRTLKKGYIIMGDNYYYV